MVILVKEQSNLYIYEEIAKDLKIKIGKKSNKKIFFFSINFVVKESKRERDRQNISTDRLKWIQYCDYSHNDDDDDDNNNRKITF